VTGATGALGRLVIAQLQTRVPAARIVVLVRDVSKAAPLGVTARPFDYTSKTDALTAALKGIDTLLFIGSSEVGPLRAVQHLNVLAAAKAAGVQFLAYTSLLHADTSTISLAEEERVTEAALKASGIPHTLLRNGWYTENYLSSLGQWLSAGAILGSAGAGRIAAATRADFALAAAVVVTDPQAHVGKTYELVGDDAFTLADLAKEVSAQVGKEVPYSDLPPEKYTEILTAAGVPAVWAEGLPQFDVAASKGDLFDDSKQLSTLIGRPTTTLAAAVKDALKDTKAQ
jgi:NAD(P)H dehydrogenase (quinone)